MTAGIPCLSIDAARDLLGAVAGAGISGHRHDSLRAVHVGFERVSPKASTVPHSAVMNTIDALNEWFEIGSDDRALALSRAWEFDLSVFDIFAMFSAGGDSGRDRLRAEVSRPRCG